MFIEVNDAPNHLSFSREAKLKNRVLRILTPSFLSKRLKKLSIVLLAGFPELLRIFESVHFQLKGTPSSSEIELLQYLISYPDEIKPFEKPEENSIESDEQFEGSFAYPFNKLTVLNKTGFFERVEAIAEEKLNKINRLADNLESRSYEPMLKNIPVSDHLLNKVTGEILSEFFENIDNEEWISDTIKSFASVFSKEHPEYSTANLSVVNGSSRTALGLLGFHCGIKEVFAGDFSWTYEHCFPKSSFIPLTDSFELDVEGICTAIDKSLASQNNPKEKIALVINNPHNASGKIFLETDLKKLLVKVLNKNVFVIDDLAYQNVLPKNSLKGPKTVKQLALELVDEGRLYKDQLLKVISIHSLSKTDSFAGARLAVIEIADKVLAERFNSFNKSYNEQDCK